MITKEFLEKADSLLEKLPIVVLASLTEDGFPRPLPLAKLKSNGVSEIWMATNASSTKVKLLRANPKAGLTFFHKDDSITLTGMAEVVDDFDAKKAMWQNWLLQHFPDGVFDFEYILIRFTAHTISGWIAGEYVSDTL